MSSPTLFVHFQQIFLILLVSKTCSSSAGVKLFLFKTCILENGVSPKILVPRNLQNSSRYAQLNGVQWNNRIPTIYPLAYFLPKSTFDVQVAVRCGSKLNVRLVPKSGGLSYELYGFGNSDSITMDFRNMRRIRVNGAERTVTVGPGALVGEIYAKVWREGKFGVSMTDAMNVGIGGSALGGGYGFFTALYGATSDNVVELQMVDAKGGVHAVNSETHSDLFWGLRGVGPGFIGIVTELKLKMFRASDLVQTRITFNIERKGGVEKALRGWAGLMRYTQNNVTTAYSTIQIKGTQITFVGQHMCDRTKQTLGQHCDVGDKNGYFAAIKANFELGPDFQPAVVDDYYECLTAAGLSLMHFPKNPQNFDIARIRNYKYGPLYYKAHNFYVDQYFDAKDDIAKAAQAIERKITTSGIALVFTGFEGGGPLGQTRDDATSLAHRRNLYLANVQAGGKQKDAGTEAEVTSINQLTADLKFMDSGESYQNYVDGDRPDYLRRYYGANLPRLIKIKAKWDSENYFVGPESIPTS